MTVRTLIRPARPSPEIAPPDERISAGIPSEVDTFVGRERELVRLRALLAETRLLSLVGPAGVGKTRLAMRLAANVADLYSGGTWLVDLSPITVPALVPQAIADAFDIQRQPGQSWLAELSRLFGARKLLLVLDNCEHLIAACAELVEGLLPSSPGVRVVLTSLQPLGTPGETIFRVPPLAVPASLAHDLDDVVSSEAVRLFVKRVQAHVSDFTLTAANARAVSEICQHLDGVPLALELVAARVESLGVAEIASRINHRFALAVGVDRGPKRQRTLQSALEWSCSLLSHTELVLLRRLSVFVGGWTLEAAEAVCGDAVLQPERIAETLGQLVTKSLVIADNDGMRVRYRLLETVRDYAATQLANVAETESLQCQHATFMVDLSRQTDPLWLDLSRDSPLASEEGNVRAALEWSIQHEQAELGLQLATAAFPVWHLTGHYLEGSTWYERVLSMPSARESELRSAAVVRAGRLRLSLGDYTLAETYAQEALQAQHVRGDSLGTAAALDLLGRIAQQRGELVRCGALQAEVVRRLRALNAPRVVLSLMELAIVESEIGDDDQLRRAIAEIEAIGEARGEPLLAAAGLHLRALIAVHEGRLQLAADLIERELAARRNVGGQQAIIKALTVLGHVRLDQGQSLAASAAFMEAVGTARVSGEVVRLLRALEGCARFIANRDADSAVRLSGATDRQRQALGAVAWPSEQRYLNEWQERARKRLGPAAYEHAWNDGHSSTLDQAIRLAEAFMLHHGPAATSSSELTSREQEVAILLARGLTNKEVASKLVVSPATARSHVEHILAKLALRTRAQVAVWAAQNGLVERDAGE